MNYLNFLWLSYGYGLLFLAVIGGIIRLCGSRGKLFRAFLIAPASGFVIFWLTYGIYLLLVPVPVAPPHRSHEDGDLLAMLYALWSLIFDRWAPSLSYYVGLYCDPVLYGGLSIPIAFTASFFFPCRSSVPLVTAESAASNSLPPPFVSP